MIFLKTRFVADLFVLVNRSVDLFLQKHEGLISERGAEMYTARCITYLHPLRASWYLY